MMKQNTGGYWFSVKLFIAMLNLGLRAAGLIFIILLSWDGAKSRSNLPEATWYTFRRTPSAYPNEIGEHVRMQRDISLADLKEKTDELETELGRKTSEISEDLKEEIENSKTECISFASIANAICIGPRQTASSF